MTLQFIHDNRGNTTGVADFNKTIDDIEISIG